MLKFNSKATTARVKSKINGALFYVEELKNENGNQNYTILDLSTGKRISSGKEWFENGIMQNLEEVRKEDVLVDK